MSMSCFMLQTPNQRPSKSNWAVCSCLRLCLIFMTPHSNHDSCLQNFALFSKHRFEANARMWLWKFASMAECKNLQERKVEVSLQCCFVNLHQFSDFLWHSGKREQLYKALLAPHIVSFKPKWLFQQLWVQKLTILMPERFGNEGSQCLNIMMTPHQTELPISRLRHSRPIVCFWLERSHLCWVGFQEIAVFWRET